MAAAQKAINHSSHPAPPTLNEGNHSSHPPPPPAPPPPAPPPPSLTKYAQDPIQQYVCMHENFFNSTSVLGELQIYTHNTYFFQILYRYCSE